LKLIENKVMRIIHTADWHLGQTLHSYERVYEHQQFLDWLIGEIAAREADALLVSGDIFDNANPSSASQKQLYHFLQKVKIRSPKLNIVLVAGNHDSPGRLEAPAPLLGAFDTAVVGHVSRDANGTIDLERLVVPLKDKQDRIAAWCLAVPFLRPGDVPRIEAAGDSYMDGIALLYKQAFELALSRREPGQAIIALGHCHMAGGQVSAESERKIVIGGVEALSAGTFGAGIAYAALGHLHRAQKVAGPCDIHYSGSPLPMSFAEIGYNHQVVCVDLEGESARSIDAIPVPRFVDLLRVPDRPQPVPEVLATLVSLQIPACTEEQRPYLEVRVSLAAPEPGLRAQVEAALNGKPVRLARIETTSPGNPAGEAVAQPVALDDLDRLQPDDIFRKLYQQRYGGDAPANLLGAFAEVLNEPAGGGST
jgi:exonuclease SbcD